MAANPITFHDIEAYCRLTLTELSAWEVDVLCRVDDAVLAARAETERRKNARSEETAEIPVSDVKGVRSLFRGIATRKRVENQQAPKT